MATARTEERLMASLGKMGESGLRFERCDDVPCGGVIGAMPALISLGLLNGVRQLFHWPAGYYPLESIFVSLSFLGLDRIPEVKTMREKIAVLCQDPGAPARWGSQLAQEWMAQAKQQVGFYYVDGHVRAYHGELANRPKAYVAREQLCLHATLDYWVNAMDGQPFFVVTQELNERLVQTLKEQIVPRLKAEAPGQPTQEELAADERRPRFVLVFDREGYSPELFKILEQERIAVVSYAKHCKATEDWPAEEFELTTLTLVSGENVQMAVAERGVCLSNGHWVREVRHRDKRGKQTAIYSTDYLHSLPRIIATLLARWCQENFFRYMIEHYSLDRLVQYGTEAIPETSKVVNPQRRSLENEIRREKTQLTRKRAAFAAKAYPSEGSRAKAFEQQQGQALDGITEHVQKIEELKARRKDIPRHVTLKELPQEQRFTGLRSISKHFIDTIKMIAYRAETILVGLVRHKLTRQDDVRSWVRQLFQNSVNLIPDPAQKTLTVQIHPMANEAHNQVLKHLCTQLTESATVYPMTELRLVFELLGPP
jgi:hypothetical protein